MYRQKSMNPPSFESSARWSATRLLFYASLASLGIALTLCVAEAPETNIPPNYSSRNLETTIELTEQVITWSHDAAVMGQIIYNDDPTEDIPGATVYTDEPDRALWIKWDDETCIAVFRGTTMQIEDWMQNFPLGDPISFESPLGKTCITYGGYHSAYFDTSFVDDFRNDIQGCIATCENGNCNLVIAGASQGAAVAAIAAVDMQDLNPVLITFGQPATLLKEPNGQCEAIDISRYYRYTNTEPLSGYIQEGPFLYYDIVQSFSLPNNTDWIGDLIVLSENEGGVVIYPHDARPDIGTSLWSTSAHELSSYTTRLEALMDSGVFPVPTEGWVDQSLCNFNEECMNGLCNNYNCSTIGADGTPCSKNSDCLAGRCDGLLNGICQPQLELGAWCTEGSDCISGKCLGKCVEGSSGAAPSSLLSRALAGLLLSLSTLLVVMWS